MQTITDPRRRAFDALVPIAVPVQRAVDRAQQAVKEELRLCGQRMIWTPQQQTAVAGYTRFSYVTNFLKEELSVVPDSSRFFSTLGQEHQGLFLWLIDDICLRVKREPEELLNESVLSLLDEAPGQADLSACLTWTLGPGPEIDMTRFKAGHGAMWVIPLDELLAAEAANNVAPMPRQAPVVISKRPTPKTIPGRLPDNA